MCGIGGCFSIPELNEVEKNSISRMQHALLHRGPDDKGILFLPHAALVHTRLSIIDPNGGSQPLSYNNHFHIVFNGEIYNYRELQNHLKKKGHQFRTNSDTEVILALYSEYGIEAFGFLRGMFSLALWDEINNLGLLVRDPAGIKPLFYYHNNDRLLFASEAKAIIKASSQTFNPDLQSLHYLMNFRYIPGNDSLFQGIHQLPPGNILSWDINGNISYTSFEYNYTPNNPDRNSFEFIEDAVKSHLVSDVPVSCYLSGGIDSAAIAAISRNHLSYPMQSYTLEIGDDPEEARNAKRSAELIGIHNKTLSIGQLETPLEKLIWHLEIPKVNALQAYNLANAASTQTKVALSGLGGDEYFIGYNIHKIIWQTQNIRDFIPNILSRGLSTTGLALNSLIDDTIYTERSRALRLLGNLDNWPYAYGLIRNVWDLPGLRELIYGPRMLEQRLDNAFDHLADLWPQNTRHTHPLAASLQYEQQQKMVNDLLWQEDRCSMAHGLEVRIPYLDLQLTRAINQIPLDVRMPGGRLKKYMRNTLSNVLPDEILKRPKSGFQVDSSTFFYTHLSQHADQYLNEEITNELGLFNYNFIKSTMKLKPSTKYRWHYFMLYMMLTTHIWFSLFDSSEIQKY